MNKAAIVAALRGAVAKLDEAWCLVHSEPSLPPPRVQTLSDSLDWPELEPAPQPPERITPTLQSYALVTCKCCGGSGLVPTIEMERWTREKE